MAIIQHNSTYCIISMKLPPHTTTVPWYCHKSSRFFSIGLFSQQPCLTDLPIFSQHTQKRTSPIFSIYTFYKCQGITCSKHITKNTKTTRKKYHSFFKFTVIAGHTTINITREFMNTFAENQRHMFQNITGLFYAPNLSQGLRFQQNRPLNGSKFSCTRVILIVKVALSI